MQKRGLHMNTTQLPAARAGAVQIGDMTVNRMGFGAMHITGRDAWGNPPNIDLCKQVLKRATELGVNFIDTADSYGPGVSEELIRQTLAPYRNVLIATKGGVLRPGPDEWQVDARPERIKRACAASRERLQLQTIDLYQLQMPDPRVPVETSVAALLELQEAGSVQNIGLCNVTLEQLQAAQQVAPVVSVQAHYNIMHRQQNEALLQYCEAQGVVFIAYFPMGGGKTPLDHPYLQQVAQKYEVSTRQIALAWLLHRSPSILVIPGTASIEHLESNIAATGITLTAADMALLDRVSDILNP